MKYIVLLVILVLLVGCASSIADTKSEDNIGKKVTVKGEVMGTIKLGSLSGYTIEDETGTLKVSSDSLPKEGDTISVKGVLLKDTIFGYYLKID